MSVSPQISLLHPDGQTFGPYHWKRIVELHELGLIDDFSYLRNSGEPAPVKELVRTLGVPPTIGVNAILKGGAVDGPPCSSQQMEALARAGMPPVSLTSELAEHLEQRMALSEAALDAEDPDYVLPLAALQALMDSSGEAAEPAPDESVDAPDEPAEEPAEEDAVEPTAPEPAPVIDFEALADSAPTQRAANPYAAQKPARSKMPLVAGGFALLLIVGAGLVWILSGSGDASTPAGIASAEDPADSASVAAVSVEKSAPVPEPTRMVSEPVEHTSSAPETEATDEPATNKVKGLFKNATGAISGAANKTVDFVKPAVKKTAEVVGDAVETATDAATDVFKESDGSDETVESNP